MKYLKLTQVEIKMTNRPSGLKKGKKGRERKRRKRKKGESGGRGGNGSQQKNQSENFVKTKKNEAFSVLKTILTQII